MARTVRQTLSIRAEIQDKITSPLAQITGRLRTFGTRFRATFNSLGSSILSVRTAFAGFAAVLVGNRIAQGIASLAEANAQVARLAASTNSTVEAVSQLGFAFESTGVGGASELQSILTALEGQRLTAIRSGGGQRDAFARLGVSLEELRTLGATELLAELSSGIENYGDKTEAVAQLQVIFSEDFRRLIPLLGNGREAYDQLTDRAERFGTVTSGQARAAEEFQDALLDLRGAFATVRGQILEIAGPEITAFIRGLAKLIVDNAQTIGRVFSRLFELLQTGLIGTIRLYEIFGQLIGEDFGIDTAALDINARALEQVAQKVQELEQSFEQAAGISYDDLISRDSIVVTERISAALEAYGSGIIEARRRLGELEIEQDRILGGTSRSIADDIRRARAEFDGAVQTSSANPFQAAEQDAEPAGGFFAGFRDQIESLNNDLQDLYRVGQRTATEIAGSLTTNLGNAINNIVTGASTAKQAFKDLTASILADLARIASKLLAERILSSIFGAIGGAAGGSASVGVGQSGTAAGAPSGFGNGFSGALGAGIGTGQSLGLAGAGGDVFNVTINAVDAASFEDMLIRSRKTFGDLVRATVGRNDGVRKQIQGL
jgi:hypothetical protein